MTREEFVSGYSNGDIGFDDLREMCDAHELSVMSDEFVDESDFDSVVEYGIKEWLDRNYWYNGTLAPIIEHLDDMRGTSDYGVYINEGCLDIRPVDADDMDRYYQEILEEMDGLEAWDDEEEAPAEEEHPEQHEDEEGEEQIESVEFDGIYIAQQEAADVLSRHPVRDNREEQAERAEEKEQERDELEDVEIFLPFI